MPQPDFRDVIRGSIAATGPRQTRTTWQLGLKLDPDMADLMKLAAEKRDLAPASYARRAIMAMVCFDLGLTYPLVMHGEGPVRPFDLNSPLERDQGGIGHGLWEIRDVG